MESSLERAGVKRKRSRSPPPWQIRGDSMQDRGSHQGNGRNAPSGRPRNDQVRINQLQEDERMREWVAQEDDFVLKQAKKKAEIRIKEGRPKPIDWLCRTLRIVDPTKDPLDDDPDEEDLEFVDPTGVLEDLSDTQLSELQKDIETYMNLEKLSKNRDYWRTMQILCEDYSRRRHATRPESRAVSSVSSDIDRLLSPKSYEELESLEGQIRSKLASREPIDTDYWQQLLDNLLVWKARAKLRRVSQTVLEARVLKLRSENVVEAHQLQIRVGATANIHSLWDGYDKTLDPDPSLQIRQQDKGLEIVDEATFLKNVAADRRKIMKLRYIPSKNEGRDRSLNEPNAANTGSGINRSERIPNDGHSQTTSALYNKEMARGFGEDEEIFAGEEEVETKNKDLWMGKYRPRKPKYFNRVQMGYEWNKYNQTHYDQDNPPPKVVQGYKFHIFYPDLIDKTKAPTYKIEREDGRKKGQSTAPAGEEDTCIIKFIAGPPYETIAFRIIDRDWDYSAKYDRGFKSTFESPGVLTLSFSFKKVYYRK